MILADQLVAHAVGDYVLQSDWMAQVKLRRTSVAVLHALTYTLPFLLLTRSVLALAVICLTHAIIDRWRLARIVVWAKNQLGPRAWRPTLTATGYLDERPLWLTTWLLIITDNVMHVLINGAALQWLT